MHLLTWLQHMCAAWGIRHEHLPTQTKMLVALVLVCIFCAQQLPLASAGPSAVCVAVYLLLTLSLH